MLCEVYGDRSVIVVVVGIDPGLANLGIGVVRERGKTTEFLDSRLIRTASDETMPQRLLSLHLAVREVLEQHRPEAIAIESQFFHEQVGTAFKVGEAVGAVLVACAQAQVPVFEYGPMEVKQALVGTGGASKEQVIFMVRSSLGLAQTLSTHTADALALALTHLASRRILAHAKLLKRL